MLIAIPDLLLSLLLLYLFPSSCMGPVRRPSLLIHAGIVRNMYFWMQKKIPNPGCNLIRNHTQSSYYQPAIANSSVGSPEPLNIHENVSPQFCGVRSNHQIFKLKKKIFFRIIEGPGTPIHHIIKIFKIQNTHSYSYNTLWWLASYS